MKFSEFFNGKKPVTEIDPYGTLNPEQKTLAQNMGTFLSENATKEAPMYTGEFVAPMSQSEQDIQNTNARLAAMSGDTFMEAMKGDFPEQYYQDAVYKPLMKQYTEEIEPLIRENYAGTGGYWGSARADAVSKGYRDVYDTLAAERANLAWQAKQNAVNAATAAPGAMSTYAQTSATPRLMQQYGLDKQYEEFVRTRPESLPYMDRALQFLNIGTKTSTYTPGFEGLFDQTLKAWQSAPANSINWLSSGGPFGGSAMTGSNAGAGQLGSSAYASYGTPTTPGYSAGYKLSNAEMAKLLGGY